MTKPMTTKSGRRKFLIGAFATGAAAGIAPRRTAWGQTTKPIKIGAVITTTGGQGQQGIDNINGMKLYFDEIGGKIAGRPIQLIVEDDENKPQVGLQKLRKLVESDAIDIICGPVSSAIANAMVDYVKQTKSFWVISGAGLAALTREKKGPLIFRTSTSSWQTNSPIGEWAVKNLAKEAVLTASDYAGGRDTIAEFKAAFVGAGGKVIKEIYPPFNNTDFSAYLADIKSIRPPFVYCFFPGSDGLSFVKQYDQFGLKAMIPLATAGFTVEGDILEAQGDSALGIISCLHYATTLDTPANKKFVAAYKAQFKGLPSYASDYGYVTARTIVEAAKLTDGNLEDKDKLAAAMRTVKFDAPRGPIEFDPATQNVIMNEYIRKVALVDGKPANVVLETIPHMRDPG
jgi:branched-chain amino acid transport system substrate-binding protein